MAQVDVPLARLSFGQTRRRDFWWVQPLVVFLGFSAFIVYSTWAAFQGDHLPVWTLPLAVLFAGIVRLRQCLVRSDAALDAGAGLRRPC